MHRDVRMDALWAARHSAFMSWHLAMALIALACLPPYLALNGSLGPVGLGIFLLLVAPILVVAYLSRTGHFDNAKIMSALLSCVPAALVAWLTGGIGSFALVWLVIVPFEASMSGSRRVVTWAVCSAVATLSAVCVLDIVGLVPTPIGFLASPAFHAAGMIVAAIYGGGLALVEHGLQRYGHELKRTGEARYALLADNINDVVTRHGPAGHVVYASPAADAMLGVEPSELVGNGLFERVHVADRPIYLCALSTAQVEGSASTVEFRFRRAAADTLHFVWVEMRCRPYGDGSERHVVGVLRDISDRKAQEIATNEARAEAERANVAKSRFLAMMSHELRTPLNAIIGFSDMLMNDERMHLNDERRREYAGLINDSGNHLLSVVNGVLDMSKIETGNFHIVPETFTLNDLVENCRNMMLFKANGSGISMSCALPIGPVDIVADKRACRQIFLNLISNALKFTEPGGSITVGARVERGMVGLFVSDTGVGIRQQDLARLGEPFFQAGSTYDRPYEGTGLGLSVVRGLAQLHGGDMQVDSVPDRGTTVTVRLPINCEAAPQAAVPEQSKVKYLTPRTPVVAAVDERGKKSA